jgi:hypothetical protein
LHFFGASPRRHHDLIQAAAPFRIVRIRIGRLGRSRRKGGRQQQSDPCRRHGDDMRFIQHENILLESCVYPRYFTQRNWTDSIELLTIWHVAMDFLYVYKKT